MSGEPMAFGLAAAAGASNALFNSVISYAFLLTRPTSCVTPLARLSLLVGCMLYVAGMLTELTSAFQKLSLEALSKSKGKVYTKDLWRYARRINFGGCIAWWIGYAVSDDGYWLGALYGAFFFWNFSCRAIPALNGYCKMICGLS
ncbi:hypothetical protein SVAN01_11816 [Stagonosporopsis vannaccii]|nr:hypothetical protein SVAN01_11816 [Stagonosporopsis vannaccii]